MREIHYIDIDEEIISAVSRLRNSGQGENVFIFPKRALILQSIVNLRLLEREAKKLGKKIIVVSQDEAGRKLAEKAGLAVEEYQDQTLSGAEAKATARFTVETTGGSIPMPEKKASKEARPRVAEIGSESFFANSTSAATHPSPTRTPLAREPAIQPTFSPAPVPALDSPKKLRVRDVSPVNHPSLNSKRGATPSTAPLSAFAPPAPTLEPQNIKGSVSAALSAPVSRYTAPRAESRGRGKLARFMGVKSVLSSLPETTPVASPSKTNDRSSRWAWSWILLSLVVLAGGVGLGFFVLFPKAVVTVEPQTAEQIIRFQGTVTTEPGNGEDLFTGRIEVLERSVQLSLDATGTGTQESAKARGKIKIYNDFSKDAQPLVATTRFETKDGKIFRLVTGVTVPGVTETGGKRERGMVEATVIADQVGAEYNIPPATFTIPGFKGGPKYDKFSAESTQVFTGGGRSGTGDGQTSVSGEDLNRAKTKAIEEAKRLVLEELQPKLTSEETLLEDSLQFTERPGVIAPPVGAVQSQFTYEARFEIKAFVVNEKMIKDRIAKEKVTTEGVTLLPHEYSVRYTALLPKYEVGRLDMTVESTVLFRAELNKDLLKQALLGKDEAGIRAFLEEHPEIERLQVEFHPQLFVSTIPTKMSRVTVEVVTSSPAKP